MRKTLSLYANGALILALTGAVWAKTPAPKAPAKPAKSRVKIDKKAPKYHPKVIPKSATEVLQIRPVEVSQSGIGHGYSSVFARVNVLSASRSASQLKAGSSIIVTFAFKGKNAPLVKGKTYRALLFKDPRATTDKKEPLYHPLIGAQSLQALK